MLLWSVTIINRIVNINDLTSVLPRIAMAVLRALPIRRRTSDNTKSIVLIVCGAMPRISHGNGQFGRNLSTTLAYCRRVLNVVFLKALPRNGKRMHYIKCWCLFMSGMFLCHSIKVKSSDLNIHLSFSICLKFLCDELFP